MSAASKAVDDASAGFVMDEDTFRAFYERTARGVWAYLVRVTGDRQQADDLLQETFYRFLRTAATYESETHRRNSLYRIATNLARDARRRSLVRAPFSLPCSDIERVPSGGDGGTPEEERRFHARHVASQAARASHVVAGLCRGRFASRDRRCARSEPRQPEGDVISRAAKAGGVPGGQAVKLVECEFESDVLAAVLQSRLPDASARTRCGLCDLLRRCGHRRAPLTTPARKCAQNAVVPDSGRVWWLAQMRARREATKAAGRPITAIQVIALACAVGLLGACFGATSLWFQCALRRVESALAGFSAATFVASTD